MQNHTTTSLSSLKKLHSFLTTNGGVTRPSPLLLVLIRGYIQMGSPESAISIHSSLQNPTLGLSNSTLTSLCDHQHYAHLLHLYAALPRSDNFTYPSVLKACASLSDVFVGREVHSQVLKSGFGGNVVVETALMDFYARASRVNEFRKVFDGMCHRDLVSWNAFLSGLSMNGCYYELVGSFRMILESGLRPNVSTLVSVIPVCASLRALEVGVTLHGLALKVGVLSKKALMPTLISMYAQCRELSVANGLFERMPEKDVIAWNAIISGCAENGKFNEAFELFQQMHHGNVKPTLISFVSVLPVCGNLMSSRCGQSIHACGIKYGYINKVPVVTSLLSMYAKLGDLEQAELLFDAMGQKNILSWNSMISGYVINGHWCAAFDTFKEMRVADVTPDSISMVSLLSACSKCKDLLLGRSAHAYSLRSGYEANHNVANALMSMYNSWGELSLSLKVFQTLADKNLSSWNTLISGSAQVGKSNLSISLFRQLQKDVAFDIVTMISILPIFEGVEDLEVGMSFHGLGIRIGYYLDSSLVNALISMYMNCSDPESGCKLFSEMPFRDVVSWNVVMTGLRNHNFNKEVMILFNEMRSHVERPNSITLLNVLPLCDGRQVGKSIHGYSIRNFSSLGDSLLTSIMCMYSRFEDVKSCVSLFELANKRNVVVWNSSMSIYIRCKHVESAVTIFRKMLKFGIEPDHITLLNLVSACAQLDRMGLVMSVTGYIMKKGFEMDATLCNSVIDMHAKCGSILMARETFNVMSGKDSVSWSTMINGYGMHGNGEAALALFNKMKETGIELDKAIFLSLLSACSHAGLVEEGRNIFRSMREQHNMVPGPEHFACIVDLLGRTGHLDEAYDIVKGNPFKITPSMLESLLSACNVHGNIELGEEIAGLLSHIDPENSRSYVILANMYAAAGRWKDSSRVRTSMEHRGLKKDPGLSLIEVK